MAEETTPTPPKRRPGRPRKNPVTEPAPSEPTPAASTEVVEDKPAPEQPAAKPAKPAADADDPHIGRAVPKGWDECGMDNGHTYRCKDGFITGRVR